ncbi:MAG TPA: tetratricopeptide repeat protein, partial [Minicystis sp.]|nr:tetratricopeptide repeat protein [Minicystis sp.]
ISSAEEAGQLAPAGSDMWGEAQRLAATALIDSGKSREGDARAAWAAGPDFWDNLSQPVRATLLAARVRGLVDMNLPQQALEVADRALDEARASGDVGATTRALDARMYALMHMGDMSKAIAASVQLIEAAETTGDTVLATRGRINTSSVLNQLGMYEEAQTMLERALADTRNRRMRILEAFTLHNLGMSQARLGRLDEGITFQRQAARIADECGAARLRINARVYEAILLVWRGGPGDLGLALSTARWLEGEARAHPGLYTIARFTLARVQLARRDLAPALDAARDAATRLEHGPVEEWEEGIRLTLVEALLESGHDKEADRALDRAFNALVDRARGITIVDHREAFLARNDEARQLVDLAKARLGRALPPLSGPLPPRPSGGKPPPPPAGTRS